MEKIRYAEMLPHEILARRAKSPAAFIGLGMLLKAQELVQQAAGGEVPGV